MTNVPDIGARRTRVRLQTVRRLHHSGGRTTEAVSDIATVWASIRTRPAGETVKADQHHLRGALDVETHFARRFLGVRRLEIAGEAYDVSAIEDPGLKHISLIFSARARSING